MATVSTSDRPDLAGRAFEDRAFRQKPLPAASPAWYRSRRAVLACAGLAGLVLLWFAPWFVAHSPLLNWALGALGPELNGTLHIGSASLGWFSPVRLYAVEICDAQGDPLLQAPLVRGDRSLLSILWDASDGGSLRFEQSTLRIEVRRDGSNLEDVLAPYLVAGDEPTALNVELNLAGGKALVRDAFTAETWQIDNFHLAIGPVDETPGSLRFRSSGTVADGRRPGRFLIELAMRPDGEPGGSELTVKSDALPWAMFDAVIERLAAGTRVRGHLSSNLELRWNEPEAADRLAVRGQASIEAFELATPRLGTDRLQFARLDAAGDGAWHGSRIEVERLTLVSDAGKASLAGSFDLPSGGLSDALAAIPRQTLQINGNVDLARLAAILPGTLRIRPSTQVTSGRLDLDLASRRGPEGMTWQGRIEARDLTAVDRGRSISWQQPLAIALAARESPQGPIVERLECKSDFLDVEAVGSPDRMRASAGFDLNRLMGRLGGIVDLDGVALDGAGRAEVEWKRTATQGFEATAEVSLRNLHVALPDRPAIREDSLALVLAATGRTDFDADTRIDAAHLEVTAGTERLEARLTQPVLDLRHGGAWSVEIRGAGELARWRSRAEPWIDLGQWAISGASQLVAETTVSAQAVQIRRARLAVTGLEFDGLGYRVGEPQAELIASGNWDIARRRLELPTATLTASSLSAQAERVVVALSAQGALEMQATLGYRGDLGRLQQWMTDPNDPSDWQTSGQCSGSAELQSAEGRTAGRIEATIEGFAASHRSGQQLREPRIQLAAAGTYDAAGRALVLDRAEVVSGSLGVRLAGEIATPDASPRLQLAGQFDYDMEKLSELLIPYVGDGVRFLGRGSSPASWQGPPMPGEAQAATGVGWELGNVYGFRLGRGALRASLSGGMVSFEPVETTLSEGRLQLAGQLRLTPEPRELYLAPGPVAQQVRINPQMCAAVLQYVAPVLAGVATAEGRFSIELDRCRIPLDHPSQSELAGRMTVHSVRVGPGPLIHELAVVLGRAQPVDLSRESVIPFQLAGGRIYHQNLELVFPELTVRTYGSVGLDQSLAVMADMPVPSKWLGTNPTVATALRDQTIRVPIAGTLSRPEVDRKVLDQLSRQFLENAARNVLDDQLQRGLNRLLGPAQPVR